jgi:hypothetical protein
MVRPHIHNLAAAVLALALASFPLLAISASCSAKSGAKVTPLIELYTSEGCDSCPPADRWLAATFPAAGADAAAVALAFHVDYWDRLGWVDRFATPVHTERQYAAMRANRTSFVYTPQVLLQGHDFSGWRRGGVSPALAAASREPARAVIELAADVEPGTLARVTATVRVPDPALLRRSSLALAYTDSGLVSEVKAGENRGVRLSHDHVVRSLTVTPLTREEGVVRAEFPMPREAGAAPTIVAFVQDRDNNDVLQTLALPLRLCVGR